MISSAQRTISNFQQAGFTLVELLMVVGLVSLMAGAAIPSFSNYIKGQNVRQAQEQLKNDFRTVLNKALTGTSSINPNVSYWGVYMQGGQSTYTFFTSATNTNCPPTAGSPHYYANTSTSGTLAGLSTIGGSSNLCVFYSLANGDANFVGSSFPACTGNLASAGLTCVNVCDTSGACKQIGMNSAGLIRSGT